MMRRRFRPIELIFQNAFWGIGYLLGFSLVTMLSLGFVFAEDYSVLIRGRSVTPRFGFFKKEGLYYLQAEYVAGVGWLFLSLVLSLLAL